MIKNKLLWTISYSVVAIGLLFAFIGLSEFYNVKIARQGAAYAFGPISDNPWYYQNASIYIIYNLVTGLIFLVASLLTIWAMIKKNQAPVTRGVGLIILFLIAERISIFIQ